MQAGKKLLDILREKITFKGYSRATEKTYIYWNKKYILFHNKKHPIDMGKKEIEEFTLVPIAPAWECIFGA